VVARSRLFFLALVVLFLPFAFVPASHAEEGKIKQGLKEAGEGFKTLGKKIGGKSAEAGHEIAGAAKRIWYRGKQVSAPLLHDVQRATRKFWDETIRGKDSRIDSLRDENEKLKKDLEEEDD
jgi:hypothetical protein